MECNYIYCTLYRNEAIDLLVLTGGIFLYCISGWGDGAAHDQGGGIQYSGAN